MDGTGKEADSFPAEHAICRGMPLEQSPERDASRDFESPILSHP